MHGIGNDFVVVDLVAESHSVDWSVLAQDLCRQHFGVGADGLLLLSRDTNMVLRMTMFNPDGSEGGMCGNGVRCVSRLAVERCYASSAFDLKVGDRVLQIETGQDQVAVNMGTYSLEGSALGLSPSATDPIIGLRFQFDGFVGYGTAVSMGNPHLVFLVDDLDVVSVEAVGRHFEHHPWFTQRCNVQFAQVENWETILLRTWERGAGLTLACGSGACASAVAASLSGKTGRRVLVRLPGGDLTISVLEDESVIMSGPAETVFSGEWLL